MEAKTSIEMYGDEKLGIRKKISTIVPRAVLCCLRLEQVASELKALWESIYKMTGYAWSAEKKQKLCEGIHPNLHEENIRLQEALEFKGSKGGVNFRAVETRKED